MDKPFLPCVNIAEASTPRVVCQICSGSPDNTPTMRSSIFKQPVNDTTISLVKTPRVEPITDLFMNCQRSYSAPAFFTEEQGLIRLDSLRSRLGQRPTPPNITSVVLLGLLLYITISVIVFTCTKDMFKGKQTHKLIDAFYFSVVTLCTIGYGDIVPDTTSAKLLTCMFILIGFGFVDILLNCLLTYVLDMQEEVLMAAMDQKQFNKMVRTYIIDEQKGRMRIRIKMCLALGVVFLCLTIGTVTVHFLEDLAWVDSFYLSVTSVTTVGYGDYAFKTAAGRCFAVIWLLTSTLAVAKSFLYLTEYRIEKRNRRMANEVLNKKLTVKDFEAADMDHDGYISKADFVIFKLREMGKIAMKDIEQISKQFDTMDHYHRRKITLFDLMEGETEEDKSCIER